MTCNNPGANGHYTGCLDKNCNELHVGDKVKFLGMIGEITFEYGAYGIAFNKTIDWGIIANAAKARNPQNKRLLACMNDNFIALWEVGWNLESYDDVLPDIEIIEHWCDK